MRDLKGRRESGVIFLVLWLCSADEQYQGHVDIYSSSPLFNFQVHKYQMQFVVEEVEVVSDSWISVMVVHS